MLSIDRLHNYIVDSEAV